MSGPARVKFYQTGTFTVGNRLLDVSVRSVQSDAQRRNSLTSGHRACQGCGEALGARYALDAAMRATNNRLVVANATGCLEVFSTPYPESSWQVAWLHSLFGNAPAVGTGIAAALKVKGRTDTRVIAQGGDGGTVDIGFGCLSGMFERNDDVLYICYDNEAYMNTGIQRSGATQKGASTTTCPSGTCIPGKREFPKDITKIIAAHELPYAAQASPHNWKDLIEKAAKGFEAGGPAFLNVISPCPRGWRYESAQTIEIAKLAVETGMWPLYEYENGKWRFTGESKRMAEGKAERRPIIDWLKSQGRFKHLLDPKWSSTVAEIQANVDRKWDELVRLSKF
jgi:pyruvate ferredoxin oxidoreductase beta subunit